MKKEDSTACFPEDVPLQSNKNGTTALLDLFLRQNRGPGMRVMQSVLACFSGAQGLEEILL